MSDSSQSKRGYAPSVFSTTTTQSAKPLLSSENPSRTSKSQKAWQKTKKFLSSIGEPPTAEYDRQQAALGLKEEKKRTVKATNYGAFRGQPGVRRLWLILDFWEEEQARQDQRPLLHLDITDRSILVGLSALERTHKLVRSKKRAESRASESIMAPNGAALPKRKPKENNFIFDLGVRGRKTGLTLPDTGIRDENGLEPMDGLFSSPAKTNGKSMRNSNTTLSSEEDMEMVESTIPEPEEVLQGRANIRLPPKSRSPIKTFLQSPARRNPSLGPVSSPTRGTIVAPRAASVSASVRRKLDFSNNNEEESGDGSTAPKRRAGSALPSTSTTKLTNGNRLSPLREPAYSNNSNRRDQDDTADMDESIVNGEDSFEMVDAGDDPEPEPELDDEPQEEEELEPEPPKKGKRKSTEVDDAEAPARKGRRGRPKKTPEPVKKQASRSRKVAEALQPEPEVAEPVKTQTGRPRKAVEATEPENEVEVKPKQKPPKKAVGKARKSGKTTELPKAKAAIHKPKLATIAESDSPQVKRGPPLPNNRGLVILRRETPAEGTGFKQTRSGRNSIKPIAYWKNERIEYSDDENEDNYGKFLMPRIKEVVRADEVEQEKRNKMKSKSSKSKKRRAEPESEEDEVAEPWETEPGEFVGDLRLWDPEDPTGLQTEEEADQIALSSAAIVTRDVRDGTFKFAKTLTLPFFGSGMVDLPPGAAKKPKSSRKMQMVFFVYYGRVQVTVNGNTFRIGKGGMWQVPRGNFYSIENDYDTPARLFFAQGCEVEAETEEAETQ
ncbi:hypothetical protein G7Y89_g1557 [Cudoniella acicularis]|uniref:CENP-C homolog n=1 Tax=Cudoniella acicularis TaxID=354080 RepID=A0A8H4RWP8_9HELO|nr:hypothetical protein G7Y89_g1557 [Cudoniella acicularis]